MPWIAGKIPANTVAEPEMGIKITRARTLPIGVDFGASMAKLAQMKVLDESVELLAAAAVEVPLAVRKDRSSRLETVGESVAKLLRQKPFHGRQCILSLPASEVFIHHLKVPKMAPADTAKAVRMELQDKLPCPVGQAVVRHVVAGDLWGDSEPRQEVIAISSRRDTVEEYLRMARRAGLDVVGVNVECCAIVECFARLFRRAADASRTTMYVDIGHSSTQVALSHGPRIVFARNLATGGEKFSQAVSRGMEIPLDQAHALRRELGGEDRKDASAEEALYHMLDEPVAWLVEELTQCIRYYESVFRNQAIERVIFLGGQAYDKRLCQTIARQLNLPAQVADPLVRVKRVEGAGMEWGLDRRTPQPDWAVAVGLSLGAAEAA
jgi:type IV pilus assembly protein PilM